MYIVKFEVCREYTKESDLRRITRSQGGSVHEPLTFSKGGDIRPAAVVLVGLVLSAIAFTLDTLIAGAAPSAFGTPGEVPTFGFGKVLLASVPAVLGNAL